MSKETRARFLTLAAVLVLGVLLIGAMIAVAAPGNGPDRQAAQVPNVSATEIAKPFVLQGFTNQKAGGIRITESAVSALGANDIWLRVETPTAGVSFANAPLATVAGNDIVVGAPQLRNGWVHISVETTTTTPTTTTITISNIRYNVAANAPIGDVAVNIFSSETTPTAGTPSIGVVENATVSASVATGFPDVGGRFFAAPAISFLTARNIIDGYPDGTFRPQNNITRAEFTKLIVEAENLPLVTTTTSAFSDVPSDHWALRYIETARQAGLVNGYPDGTFRPNNDISRAEIATLIVRAAGFPIDTSGIQFPDVPADHWARNFILTARNRGIIQGFTDGTFRPNAMATRAEASTMIFNWLTDAVMP